MCARRRYGGKKPEARASSGIGPHEWRSTDPTIPRPSFDCAQARTAAARLICSDAELASADGDLGRTFQKQKAGLPAADLIQTYFFSLARLAQREKHTVRV